jgi:hypothetical protein
MQYSTTRSPLYFPAQTDAFSQPSSLVTTAAWYCPVATPWAPVSVAMSTTMLAFKSLAA